MSSRPRGALARALHDKVHNDQLIENFDMSKWYTLPKLPEKYETSFISFYAPDETTLSWLESSKETSSQLWLQLWYVIARMFLGFFMTQTDVNGILKRGSMFILSEAQFSHLLKVGGFDPNKIKDDKINILDIGAGDGEVTFRLAKSVMQNGENIALNVYVTETSWIMKDRLQEKSFQVLENISDVRNINLISCLNVLDRCIDPHQILIDIYNTLAPNGRIVIALVLPYSHYVEKNTSHMPLKPLLPHWPGTSLPFEAEVSIFFDELEKMGFKIEAWTKAPYLCQGDLRQSYYWLTDVVVVLSKHV